MKKIPIQDARRKALKGETSFRDIQKPEQNNRPPDPMAELAQQIKSQADASSQAASAVLQMAAIASESMMALAQQIKHAQHQNVSAIQGMKPEPRPTHWVFKVKKRGFNGEIEEMDARAV